jgi:hypothetical protein
MDQPDLFTLARASDLVTSREAAASVASKITSLQELVLEFAKRHPQGFTDRALEDDFKGLCGPSTVRTRRSELRDKGLIAQKRDAQGKPVFATIGPSKRRHIVWAAKV